MVTLFPGIRPARAPGIPVGYASLHPWGNTPATQNLLTPLVWTLTVFLSCEAHLNDKNKVTVSKRIYDLMAPDSVPSTVGHFLSLDMCLWAYVVATNKNKRSGYV